MQELFPEVSSIAEISDAKILRLIENDCFISLTASQQEFIAPKFADIVSSRLEKAYLAKKPEKLRRQINYCSRLAENCLPLKGFGAPKSERAYIYTKETIARIKTYKKILRLNKIVYRLDAITNITEMFHIFKHLYMCYKTTGDCFNPQLKFECIFAASDYPKEKYLWLYKRLCDFAEDDILYQFNQLRSYNDTYFALTPQTYAYLESRYKRYWR